MRKKSFKLKTPNFLLSIVLINKHELFRPYSQLYNQILTFRPSFHLQNLCVPLIMSILEHVLNQTSQ